MDKPISLNPNSSIENQVADIQKSLAQLWSRQQSAVLVADTVKKSLVRSLAGSEPTMEYGTVSQYWRGDKTWQTLNQAAVAGLTTADSPTLTSITLSGLVASGMLYSNATKVITSTVAPSGYLLIGSTGADPVVGAITGTANRVTVTLGAGTIALTGPQDIHTTASPAFVTVKLSLLSDGFFPYHHSDANGLYNSFLITNGTDLFYGNAVATYNAALSIYKDGNQLRLLNDADSFMDITVYNDSTARFELNDAAGHYEFPHTMMIGTTSAPIAGSVLEVYSATTSTVMTITSQGASGSASQVNFKTGWASGDFAPWQVKGAIGHDGTNMVIRSGDGILASGQFIFGTSSLGITALTDTTTIDPYISLRHGATPTEHAAIGFDHSDSAFKIAVGTALSTGQFVYTSTGLGINTSIAPATWLQIGIMNYLNTGNNDTIGTVPLVDFIGDNISTTPQTMLRLYRKGIYNGADIQVGCGFDIDVYSAVGYGSPYEPATVVDFKIKSVLAWAQTADITIMKFNAAYSTYPNKIIIPIGQFICSPIAINDDVRTAVGYSPFILATNANAYNSFVNIAYGDNADGAAFYALKTRSAGTDANTAVNSGDNLLGVGGLGADGANYQYSSLMIFQVDGAVSSGKVPGRTVWYTYGLTTGWAERMRLTSEGSLGIGTTPGASVMFDSLCTANKHAIKGTAVTAGCWAGLFYNSQNANMEVSIASDVYCIQTNGSSISMKEIAAAPADIAAYGQIWVKNTTPNKLYFTDDAGTDHEIAFV